MELNGAKRVGEEIERLRSLGLEEDVENEIIEILREPLDRDERIRELYGTGLLTQAQVGFVLGLSQGYISKVVRGIKGKRFKKRREERRRRKEREEELKRVGRRAIYKKKLRDILEAVPHKGDVDRIMEYYIRNREAFYNNPPRLFELLRAFNVGALKARFIVSEFFRKPWDVGVPYASHHPYVGFQLVPWREGEEEKEEEEEEWNGLREMIGVLLLSRAISQPPSPTLPFWVVPMMSYPTCEPVIIDGKVPKDEFGNPICRVTFVPYLQESKPEEEGERVLEVIKELYLPEKARVETKRRMEEDRRLEQQAFERWKEEQRSKGSLSA